MASLKNRVGFVDSEKGQEIINEFRLMTEDPRYNTSSSFSANSMLYPDNLMPFEDKHVNYIISHPGLNLDQYLSNVKLITRLNS